MCAGFGSGKNDVRTIARAFCVVRSRHLGAVVNGGRWGWLQKCNAVNRASARQRDRTQSSPKVSRQRAAGNVDFMRRARALGRVYLSTVIRDVGPEREKPVQCAQLITVLVGTHHATAHAHAI